MSELPELNLFKDRRSRSSLEWSAVARRALGWARERNYVGYNKHDGLNSRLLERLTFGNKWARIAATQSIMRSPVNLRPLMGVVPAPNPKGLALFARAWLNLYEISGDDDDAGQARALIDRLLESPSREHGGAAWGYGYPWQDLGFFAPARFPNRIVTYFVARALIHAFEVLGDERYLDAAHEAVRFILEAPRVLYEDEHTKCVSYVPRDDITMAVMDVSSLCGVVVAAVGKHRGDAHLIDEARRLVAWVADKQLDTGAWYYTHPPGDSHITHDNYHTGEIVDSLLEYERYTDDDTFRDAYARGLAFYRESLFTETARPKWMHDRVHPHDAHGYAQGIISFSHAGDLDRAVRVATAALEDIWDEREARFYYQVWPLYTLRFTLMRWCQAWMSFAISSLARTEAVG